MKIKTHVLTVSRYFPQTHKRAGQETGFIDAIANKQKIHTIRNSYDNWARKIKEVQDGKAILSLRYWEGNPYMSKQIEFAQLGSDSDIGFQEIKFLDFFSNPYVAMSCEIGLDDKLPYHTEAVAKNDGLSKLDFMNWFKGYDLREKMIVIHFTKFRY